MEMAISPSSLLYCWGRTNTPREGLPAATERTQNEGPTAEKHGNVTASGSQACQLPSMLGVSHRACWESIQKPALPPSYLAFASTTVAPPHQALIVLILLGQVVIEDTLSHCLQDRERDKTSEECAVWAAGAESLGSNPTFSTHWLGDPG